MAVTVGAAGRQVLGVFLFACLLLFGVVSSAQAEPVITTNASGPVAVGGQIHDTATVTGAASPTGEVTFRLYWPGDTGCTHDPAFTSTTGVIAGSATSSPYTPRVGGTFRWTASYSGEADDAATGACNDVNESVTVSKARPTLTTRALATVALGGQISDTATLSGRFKEGGHIPCRVFLPPPPPGMEGDCVESVRPPPFVVFSLYGPDDPTCVRPPVFTSVGRLSASGTNEIAGSAPFTPTAPGTYRWIARYLGDDANEAAQGACGAPNESVLVTVQAPDTAKPVLGALSISPARFRARRSGPSIAAAVGSTVSYSLSETASVYFRVQRALQGRRVSGRCVRPKRSNRRARKCTRYRTLSGSFTHKGHTGSNKFRFTGRLTGRKLVPGRYRLRGRALDATGNKSAQRRIRFRILRQP